MSIALESPRIEYFAEFDNRKVYRTELTPLSFLRRSATVFPDQAALIHGNRGVSYSYRELAGRVNRLASALRGAGLRQGDRVAYLCPNIPAMVEAQFAAPAAGGVLVAINPRLSAPEIGYILHHSGARFLFVDAEFLPLIEPLDLSSVKIIRIDDTGIAGDPYEDFLANGSPEPAPRALTDEEEIISINYTSGTTGQPKGVICTYRGVYLTALGNVIEIGLSGNSVFLLVVPLFHVHGWCVPWAVAAVGGTQVCLRRVAPDIVWELFDRYQVTHYNGAPTVHSSLVNHRNARRRESPMTLMIAGAPPSPTLLANLRELNFRPVHLYGLTETYAPYTICEWHRGWDALSHEEQAQRLAWQGQSYVVADPVRVVDEEMRDVPRDGLTIGEVVMRGNTVMKGYYRQAEATAEAFRYGWFHSGDLAVMHPEGYIELRDRKKDIVISGGENISSIEVEQTIAKHPSVLECAVIAIPDETWGERPKAFVTLKSDHEATAEEILKFCRANLARFKCPAAVEFGELPKTSTGKIQKYVLREKEWVGYEKRIH